MSEKLKVTFEVCARLRVAGECEMTREEYEQWCERIDNARGGWEREKVADELMDMAQVSFADGDIDYPERIRLDELLAGTHEEPTNAI